MLDKPFIKILIVFTCFIIWICHFNLSYSEPIGYNPKGDLERCIGKAKEKFRFFVLGDTQNPAGNIEPFEEILERAKRERPAFVIHLGDFVPKGTDKEYKFFLNEVEETGILKQGIPLFLVVGNHDLDRWTRRPGLFQKYFGPTKYWFSFGNSLFVVIDTGDGVLDDEQLSWIESLLKERRKEFLHTFFFMHIPPINFDIQQNRSISRGAGELMALMESYRVDRVFCSHYHTYRRQSINGVDYVLTGGGGAKLMDKDSFYHYLEIEVNGDKIVEKIVPIDHSYGISDVLRYQLANNFPWILSYWPYILIAILSSLFLSSIIILKFMVTRRRS